MGLKISGHSKIPSYTSQPGAIHLLSCVSRVVKAYTLQLTGRRFITAGEAQLKTLRQLKRLVINNKDKSVSLPVKGC